MQVVIVILFVGVVMAILAVFVIASAKKTSETWRTAARRLKLRHYPGNMLNPGVITGTFHTHQVKISTFNRSSGQNSTRYTKFRITYGKPINFKFKLSKQNLLHNFGKIFGMEDIQIGDDSFDDRVLVQGADHLSIVRFLTAPRRNLIKSAMHSLTDLKITNRYIEANIRGTLDNSIIIIGHTERVADLADILSRKRKKRHPIKQAKRARSRGDINKAVKILKEAKLEEQEDKLEAMELQGEMLYIADKKKEAAETFKQLAKEMPGDKHAEEWQLVASGAVKQATQAQRIDNKSAKEPNVETSKKSKATIKTPAASNTLTAEDICNKIFNSGLSTFDATKVFEEQYNNSAITWEATLISAFEFSFDFVFKNSSGVKATFELMELKSEYTTAKIKAIVHFPKDQLENLKKLKESKVSFSGKLINIDALMKNIFITDGEIRKT